jgi:hypothetical protein
MPEQKTRRERQMLTKEPELAETSVARFMRYIGTAIVLIAILMMCESEFFLIQKLWYKAGASFDLLGAVSIPFVALVPGLCGFSLFFVIGRLGKNGKISSAIASQLKFNLALLMMMTYSAITQLASLSTGFR